MNFLNDIIVQTIAGGVAETTIILFLLIPLVASLVAAARHLVGFRGLGIFIPTALALAFFVTGIGVGLFVFAAILATATLARKLLRTLQLHYLPRMALLLWFVTLAILALIFISPYFGLGELTGISIFPILILILLAEEFIEVQIGKSLSEAMRLTLETIVLALLGFVLLSLPFLQRLALEQPVLVMALPLVINILVGKFTGLRLLEYGRFRRLLK